MEMSWSENSTLRYCLTYGKCCCYFHGGNNVFALLKMYPAIVFEAFDIVLTSLSYTQSDLAVANRGVVYFRVRSPHYPPVLDILLPVAWASDGRDQRHIVSHPKDAGNVG